MILNIKIVENDSIQPTLELESLDEYIVTEEISPLSEAGKDIADLLGCAAALDIAEVPKETIWEVLKREGAFGDPGWKGRREEQMRKFREEYKFK